MIIKDIETGLLYEIQPTKTHGENAMTCPVCSKTRKKKFDKCFSWNADNRVGRCNHCDAKFVEYRTDLKERPQKTYTKVEWKNKTGLTDKAAQWFASRKIYPEVLNRMKIYSDKVFMPQFNSEVEAVCFPYFVGGELKNIKTRGSQKSFRVESGAELVFYNLDCVTADIKELIICEGEMDALTFMEAGFSNVISVPNGAGGTNLEYLDNYAGRFDHIVKFYIATDFDEPGLKLRNELVRRFGFERCAIVTYEGRKDANDLLMSEGIAAVKRAIENAHDVPVEGGIPLESRQDDIHVLFMNGLPEGSGIGISEVDKYIRWQTSRLAIWTGIPSHGKSEMVDLVTLKLCLLYGWKTLFFSPENFPLEYHYAKLASKITGKEFKYGKMTEQEADETFEFVCNNFYWMEPYSEATIDSILKRTEFYIRRHGIKQLVIDPYNCLEHQMSKGESESVYIGRFLDTLARFSKKHDILIHLVAHPRKPERGKDGKYPAPDLYDISGSANFYNKADYGLTVHRDFENCKSYLIVTKVKFKNLGEKCLDGIELYYTLENGRYGTTSDIYLRDSSNWLHDKSDLMPFDNQNFTPEYEEPF